MTCNLQAENNVFQFIFAYTNVRIQYLSQPLNHSEADFVPADELAYYLAASIEPSLIDHHVTRLIDRENSLIYQRNHDQLHPAACLTITRVR